MIRARLVREVSPGVLQYVTFIGPSLYTIPRGWSIVMRRATTGVNR